MDFHDFLIFSGLNLVNKVFSDPQIDLEFLSTEAHTICDTPLQIQRILKLSN